MNKHFFAIVLLLSSLLVSSPAEARLTLGVVIGPDSVAGEVSSRKVDSLAALLAEGLQEEILVKELADSETLVNWLDRFAMLDLALLSSKEVKANPGQFLTLGEIDGGTLVLVSRQGIGGDLPQRAGKVLSRPGFSPAEKTGGVDVRPPPLVEERPLRSEPRPVDKALDAQQELEQVPPLSPGRAWTPQEEDVYRDLLPRDEPALKKLVLGVVPDPGGLMRTEEQAQQLADYLEQALPVSIKIREFASMEAFSEWFMRYKMVDLAVLSPVLAEASLGRDYQPLVKFLRSDKPGEDSAELVIMRRGQNQELLAPLQGALLDTTQASAGRVVLTALRISEVLALDDAVRLPTLVEEVPEPVQDAAPAPPALPEEVVEDVVEEQPPVPVYVDPVEPVAPPQVIVKSLPEVPQPGRPRVVPPMPVASVVAPALPEQKTAPAAPEEPAAVTEIELPEVDSQTSEPMEPPVPPAPPLVAATAPPEIVPVVEPPAVPETPQERLAQPPAVPESIEPPALDHEDIVPVQVAEEAVALLPPEDAAEPVGLVEAPEMPVAPLEPVEPVSIEPPASEPEELVSAQLPEETVLAEEALADEALEPVEVAESEVEPTETVVKTVEDSAASARLEEAEQALPDTVTIEEQRMIEEAKLFAELIPAPRSSEPEKALAEENPEGVLNAEIIALLGEDSVAAMVAQPDIPQEFRPSGVPVIRAPRASRRPPMVEDELIVASLPEPLKQTAPAEPPQLLPPTEPEPGVIYVIPFVSIMVPSEVNARIFDQFVDLLNQGGEELGVQFVILKEGLQRVDPTWLQIRKYVTGEIYAYVEDSGCCSTDMRTKARLTYRRPGRNAPAFGYEYPVKRFFDHDRSTVDVERVKLADDIAAALASELLASLRN